MLEIILGIVSIVLLIVVIILLFLIIYKNSKNNNEDKQVIDVSTKEDLNNLKRDLSNDFSNLKNEFDNKLTNTQSSINNNVNQHLDNFKNSTSESVNNLSSTLKENVGGVSNNVKENTEKIEQYLNSIRETLTESLNKLQEENSKKLEEMRRTVDEKLESTLNTRLTESFKLVQENLNKVSEGLGEMKTLANGVGDLKRVLSNVKTRGIWGEIQLGTILSEILSSEQYEVNVITKPKSKDPVEFAVKLPGDGTNVVYLPIDSKFPLDAYTDLLQAYDEMDKEKVDKCLQVLKQRIKQFAKDIKDKYIEPPFTTDFGIMFLPIEGLYAEVAKAGLIEELQNNYRIIVAGPTTMSALLNSLQVGFRTLAIEKRSSEVWNVLSAVKTEFANFEDVLKKAQSKIKEANGEIEKLVGTRTRQIQRKLKEVTEIDVTDAKKLLEFEED